MNFRDLDSDNDGINDLTEAKFTGIVDANSDGVVDGPDADGDGIRDSADANDAVFGDPDLTDTPSGPESDNKPDFIDLDSDNDGINDLTEANMPGIIDANSDGVVDGPDADGDGIRDSADSNDALYGDPDVADDPIDTDGDGIADFRDLDSDNDSVNDIVEAAAPGVIDANQDGLVDGTDADGDGLFDSADANDFLYGDPEVTDTPVDTDGDGTPDYRDLDSDNDSVSDLAEFNDPLVIDANNDGIVDGGDLDGDGIRDSADNNDAYFGESGVPLPIKLIEFAGTKEESRVKLNWRTGSEINSSHYLVYRSKDGIEFELVGRVKSSNSVAGDAYYLYDKQPYNGINYYRLTSVDFDGSSENSGIIVVEYNGIGTDFVVYESNDELLISSKPALVIYKADLLNDLGQLIRTNPTVRGEVLMQVSDISKGLYLLRLETPEGILYKKVIIQ